MEFPLYLRKSQHLDGLIIHYAPKDWILVGFVIAIPTLSMYSNLSKLILV